MKRLDARNLIISSVLIGALFVGCSHLVERAPSSDPGSKQGRASAAQIKSQFPILFQVQQTNGSALAPDTQTWMQNWLGINLESGDYEFPKESGSTSLNLKIAKSVPGKKKPQKLGLFLATCDSGQPASELAYFNTSAILGWDRIYRPAARYELGPIASAKFLEMITAGLAELQSTPNADNLPFGSDQKKSATNIQGWIIDNQKVTPTAPLKGCLKAEKDPTTSTVESMKAPGGDNGIPNQDHLVIAALRATKPMPTHRQVTVWSIPASDGAPAQDYTGDLLELATEYSVIMTLDAVFQQDDRYSGGNIGIRKDAEGQAHFYSIDNGGGVLNEEDPPESDQDHTVKMNLGWFDRYDRKTIAGLTDIYNFLSGSTTQYLGYTDPVQFVADLGFYFEQGNPDDHAASVRYAKILTHNLQIVLAKVKADVAQYSEKAVFLN